MPPDNMKPVLLVVTADDHPNSNVGLCHPDGVPRDEGGVNMPSSAQLWLWDCWDDLWTRAERKKRELGALLYWTHSGDGVDDNAHSKYGLMSLNEAVIVEHAVKVKRRALQVADQFFCVRGTEAHVGQGAALEELVARECGAVDDPDVPGNRSRWAWRVEFSGVPLFFRHKPDSNSTRFYTRGGGANRTAVQVEMACARLGIRRPAAAYFGHTHHMEDSGDSHPVRVFFVPPFSLASGWAQSMGFYAEPVGARLAVCDGGTFEPLPADDWTYRPVTEDASWSDASRQQKSPKRSKPLSRLFGKRTRTPRR